MDLEYHRNVIGTLCRLCGMKIKLTTGYVNPRSCDQFTEVSLSA